MCEDFATKAMNHVDELDGRVDALTAEVEQLKRCAVVMTEATIAKLGPRQPGDVVVLQLRRRCSPEQMEVIRLYLQVQFGLENVLVLAPHAEVMVVNDRPSADRVTTEDTETC